MPYRLAGFGDEISADIQRQMDHLLDNDVKLCALRGANKKAVLDFEDFQINLIKTQFFNRAIKFSCIASPCGGVSIADPFAPELERFKKACTRAKQFETRVVGVYGFQAGDPAAQQAEAVKRLKDFAQYAKDQSLNLLLENAPGTCVDTADRMAAVVTAVGAPNLMVTLDFASCVAAGDDPLAAWNTLKRWIKDFHIKDRNADGRDVPAGAGLAKIRDVLADAWAQNWTGLLTLEPHLVDTPGFESLDGAARFKAAAEALKKILAGLGAA
ncbi:MAG: hypothetical protein AMXMBFR7_49530 [Planctomycetota bacterium]